MLSIETIREETARALVLSPEEAWLNDQSLRALGAVTMLRMWQLGGRTTPENRVGQVVEYLGRYEHSPRSVVLAGRVAIDGCVQQLSHAEAVQGIAVWLLPESVLETGQQLALPLLHTDVEASFAAR